MGIARVDYHIHSGLSDGQGTLAEIVEAALARGLAAIAVTDHCDPADPCLTRRGVDPAKALGWAEQAAGETRLRVRIGLEIGPGGPPRAVNGIWPIIASVHYLARTGRDLFDRSYWEEYKLAVLALADSPGIHILGHPAGYLPFPPGSVENTTYEQRLALAHEVARRFFDRPWYEELARRTARSGVAVEIHAPSRSPAPEMLRILRINGARFSVGSDAHSLDRIGDVEWALDALEQAGGTRRDLLMEPERP